MPEPLYLRKYKRQVKKMLPRNYPNRQRLMSNIDNMLFDYVERCPNSTYDELVKEHGAPEELIAALINDLNGNDILCMFKKYKKKCIITACLITTIILIIGYGIYRYNLDNSPMYIEEQVTVYKYTTP